MSRALVVTNHTLPGSSSDFQTRRPDGNARLDAGGSVGDTVRTGAAPQHRTGVACNRTGRPQRDGGRWHRPGCGNRQADRAGATDAPLDCLAYVECFERQLCSARSETVTLYARRATDRLRTPDPRQHRCHRGRDVQRDTRVATVAVPSRRSHDRAGILRVFRKRTGGAAVAVTRRDRISTVRRRRVSGGGAPPRFVVR